MRSTEVTRRTKEQSHTIAKQGSNGRNMPAVPVLQEKTPKATPTAPIQRVNEDEGDLLPVQARFNPASGDNEQSKQSERKPSRHTIQNKENKTGLSETGVNSGGVGQLKLKDSSVNTSGTKVTQLAGTKPNQPSVDGRYRIKLSSEREAFTYTNRAALGLDAVLPGHHPVTFMWRSRTGKMRAVKIAGSDAWIRLKEPIDMPGTGQRVLCIDTVGWEDESAKPVKDQKCVMDVKIGTYTKSSEQFALEGANFLTRFFKKIEHNMKDLSRDSRGLGYDIDAGNLSAFLDLAIAPATSQKLRAAMICVKPRLQALQERMEAAPVTFVGSSVFIVFNLTAPQNSDAKLIDPDHPIVIDPGALVLPDQLVRRGNFTGSRTWEQYVTKWKDGFGTGIDNFMKWFNDLSG